jgi:DUF4097 and DUF4098 domain-containing protein YvlB
MPTFETAAPDHVEVTLAVGDLHLITGTRDRASVAVNPADPAHSRDVEAADRAEVELTDGRLVVRATEPRPLGRLLGPNARTGSVDVVVEVPDGVALTVTAQVASVRVDGPLGRTEIRTQVGSIHLDRTGDVTARTSGGDVTIGHVGGQARVQGMGTIHLGTLTGPAEVRNVTGPVAVGSAAGSLRLRSSTGDLAVDAASTDVHARTAGGAITVGAASAGTLDLRTSGGTIRVGIPEGTSVLLDATTKLGRVEQQLTAADGPAPTDRRAEIRAHTSMGDIVVHRA